MQYFQTVKLAILVFAVACTLLARVGLGANCYPGAYFPKLIGYGGGITDVRHISRRSSDGFLVLSVASNEPAFTEAIESTYGGEVGRTASWILYDPDTDTYKWQKMIPNVQTGAAERPFFAKFTGNGARILIFYYANDVQKPVMAFLDPATGSAESLTGFASNEMWGYIPSDDAIVMTNDGSKVFFVHKRISDGLVGVVGVNYDDTSGMFNNFSSNFLNWYADIDTIDAMKPAITISDDESQIFTITSNENGGLSLKMDCRIDQFSATFLGVSLMTSGEASVQSRSCRYPAFKTQADDGFGTVFMLLMITEYFSEAKNGFLRFKMNSDYVETFLNSDERVWSGNYDMRYTSAYYPTTELVYATAVESDTNMNYLIQYSWNDPNKAPQLYPLKGLSNDPNAFSFVSNPMKTAVIYSTNSDTNDFPVKGYIAGQATSVWAWNDCLAPEFGITSASYQQLVSSPNPGQELGFVSRIELDLSSCNKEQVDEITSLVGSDGQGLTDDHEGMETVVLDLFQDVPTGFDESFAMIAINFLDVLDASFAGSSAGDWEAHQDLTACQAKSADETQYIYTDAVFEGDDIIDYTIGSGAYLVTFIDWLVNGGSCTVDFDYQVREYGALDLLKVATNNFDLVAPDSSGATRQVQIESADSSVGPHIVSVLATSPSYQCMQKDFTVRPSSCSSDTFSGALWASTGIQSIASYDHAIGIDADTHSFISTPVNSLASSCPTLYYTLQHDQGGGVFVDYTGPLASFQQSPEQLYITTTASDYGLDQTSETFRVAVASVSDLSAATYPAYMTVTVRFVHPCNSVQFLDNGGFVSAPFVTSYHAAPHPSPLVEPLADFAYDLLSESPPIDCGAQTISVTAVSPIETGQISDFIKIDYDGGVRTLFVAATNSAQTGQTYTLSLQVSFDSYSVVTYSSPSTFDVQIRESCEHGFLLDYRWMATGSTTLEPLTAYLDNNALTQSFMALPDPTQCQIVFSLTEQRESQGSFLPFTGSDIAIDPVTYSVTIQSADLTLDQRTQSFRLQAALTDGGASISPFQYLSFSVSWQGAAESAMLEQDLDVDTDQFEAESSLDKDQRKAPISIDLRDVLASDSDDLIEVKLELGLDFDALEITEVASWLELTDLDESIDPGEYGLRLDLGEREDMPQYVLMTLIVKEQEPGSKLDYEFVFTTPKGRDQEEGTSDPPVKYIVPVIESISYFGELTLAFSAEVDRPTNDTAFEQKLKAMILTTEIKSGQLEQAPALEVTFIDSYSREVPIEFNWSLIGWLSPTQMQIQLTYDRPGAVSMEYPADEILITFWDSSLFRAAYQSQGRRLQDNTQTQTVVSTVEQQLRLRKKVPTQVARNQVSESIEVVATSLTIGIQAGGSLGFLSSMFFGFALNWLWSLLNAIQLTVHLPMFSTAFPGTALLLYGQLVQIAKFDLVETEGFVPRWFDLDPDEQPYSDEFERLQYVKRNFLMNCGFIFIIWVIILGLVVITFILRVLRPLANVINKASQKLNIQLYWNMIIRNILELSLELSIIGAMDIYEGNWSTWGYIFSYVVSVLALTTLLAFVVYIRFCVRPIYQQLKTPAKQQSIGSLYQGLNLKSKVKALGLTEWFLLRRMLFAAAAFFAQGHLWLQLQALFNSSIFNLFLVGTIRPYDSLPQLHIELLNECALMLIQYHIFCFSQMVDPAETRSAMGVSCVVFTVVAILGNFLVMLASLVHHIKLRFKRIIIRKRFRKQQAELKKRSLLMKALKQDFSAAPDVANQPQTVDLKAKHSRFGQSLNAKIPTPKVMASPDIQGLPFAEKSTMLLRSATGLEPQVSASALPSFLKEDRLVSEASDAHLLLSQGNIPLRGLGGIFYGKSNEVLTLAPIEESKEPFPPRASNERSTPPLLELSQFELKIKLDRKPLGPNGVSASLEDALNVV